MKTSAHKDTTVTNLPLSAPWPPANRIADLLEIALEASKIRPPDYFRSVFGPPGSWLPPHRRFSEYNIINPWRLPTTAGFLADITVPSMAVTTPGWARMIFPEIITRRFWRPTGFFRQADEYGNVCSYPDEHWFFINGIATNQGVAEYNASYLAHLFHRPVTVIQNATNSLGCDLWECVVGKGFKTDPNSSDRKTMTEPAWRATTAILEALNAAQTRRVIVIAHSQGTIIVANVLRALAKVLQSRQARLRNPRWHSFTNHLMGGVQTEIQKILRNNLAHAFYEFAKGGPSRSISLLEKLEIYTFANCADKMRYVDPALEIPYMEHFANQFDIVARLGVLSPLGAGRGAPVEIDGAVHEQKEAWGHLLNEHYLTPIDDFLYPGSRKFHRETDPFPGTGKRTQKPRLYGYFHGKRPKKAA